MLYVFRKKTLRGTVKNPIDPVVCTKSTNSDLKVGTEGAEETLSDLEVTFDRKMIRIKSSTLR